MGGHEFLDGSPDPVGLEPDDLDADEDAIAAALEARQRIEGGDAPTVAHRFDPATDAYDDHRQQAFDDWNAQVSAAHTTHYAQCATCGQAFHLEDSSLLNEPGKVECEYCRTGEPRPTPKRPDPAPLLASVKQTRYRASMAIPYLTEDPESRAWTLLETPLLPEGMTMFVSGKYALLVEPTTSRSEDSRGIADWEASIISVPDSFKSLLEAMGFIGLVRTGTTTDVDLPGYFSSQAWNFVSLSRK